MNEFPVSEKDFPAECYYHDGVVVAIAPTWYMSTKVKFDDFKKDLYSNPIARARYGSRPEMSGSKYIRNPQILKQRFVSDRHHPFNQEGQLEPWFQPTTRYPRYVHIDTSYARDATGIAMTYYDEIANKVVVDFVLRIPVPTGDQLRIASNRQLVMDLQARGFDIIKVTADSFQSVETIQELNYAGIEAEVYSVDKNTQAYDTLVDLIYSSKIDCYPYIPLITELKDLVLVNRKVDHPQSGSKDVADACAAAVFHAYENRPTDCGIREEAKPESTEKPNRWETMEV